jgi:hypothetical protein
VGLEDDFAIRRHGQSIAIGQREGAVIVQDRIEIFNPERVDGPVED